MILQDIKILWNINVNPSCYRLGIEANRGYSAAEPGQFVTLQTSNDHDPLLRRPFSIHRLIVENGEVKGIEILYKVVGRSTKRLAGFRKGDVINMLGPLGNGFSISDAEQKIVMVAGGIGVAPLRFLGEAISRAGMDTSKCRIFFGGASKHDLLCVENFTELKIMTSLSTDDGSAGHKGPVTDLLKAAVEIEKPDVIYACGPCRMLNTIAEIANKHHIKCQMSVETIMVCGIGACLGCAVEKTDNSEAYGHVCIDGPVFDSQTFILREPS